MKSVHIRSIPESTLDRLKLRASRHHRSLQGELLAVLEAAAKEVSVDDNETFFLHTTKTAGRQDWSREAIYED